MGKECPQIDLPKRRFILLGASNVVRALPTVVQTAWQSLGGPLEFVAAIGHGRSYGLDTRVLGRWLPSIHGCGIWDQLSSRRKIDSVATITDVGNDIVYGVDPTLLVEWVERCVVRLEPICKKIVLTELPLASLRKLGPKRFVLLRSLLFPRSRLDLNDALRKAEKVNQQMSVIAERHGLQLVQPAESWFGFDPIHIKRRYFEQAWRCYIPSKGDIPVNFTTFFRFRQLATIRFCTPQKRRLWGWKQQRQQPCLNWSDGSTLSFF
ncbi:MAG: hypothetical protein MK165_09890 [Pirellulaceae bacterium]|nr:hypothetical protein [Pirellulaceae bacterium]